MPPASRRTDHHTCPLHGGGPVRTASGNTIIGGLFAARASDLALCSGAIDVIQQGSGTVLINGLEAARIGDPTVHGGMLAVGEPTVLIGDSPQSRVLIAAAAAAKPFAEECPLQKARREAQEAAVRAAEERYGDLAEDDLPDEEQSNDGETDDRSPSEDEESPYSTTDEEKELAATQGDTPRLRNLRERVVREALGSLRGDVEARANAVLGIVGVPPRPGGAGIDLSLPVRLVEVRPPLALGALRDAATGVVSDLVTPLADAVGAASGLPGQIVAPVPPGGGAALAATAAGQPVLVLGQALRDRLGWR